MPPHPRLRRLRHSLPRLGVQLAVVVVGVALALWADAWRESRGDRRSEIARLEALELNVAATERGVTHFLAETRSVQKALSTLLGIDQTPGNGLHAAFTGLVTEGFLGIPFLDAELDVYRDLQHSGELSLLRDVDVRQALSAMDARLGRLVVLQADLATTQQLNVDPYLLDHMDLAPMLLGRPGPVHTPVGATAGAVLDPELSRGLRFRNLAAFKIDQLQMLEAAALELEASLSVVRVAVDHRLVELGAR
jgi:hypothetical protein